MAWPKMFTQDDKEKKETVVADPEKKVDAKDKTPAEKSPAELIAEALKPVTDGFATLRAEIDELKVKTTPKDKHEVASVLDNEDEAFNQRLTPIMVKTLELEAKDAKREVEAEYRKAGYADLWEENRKDIDDFLNTAQLVTTNAKGEVIPLRGSPEFIRNVADMMIGRAVKKQGVKFDGKDKKFFLEDATGDETVVTRRATERDGLTKKNLQAAARFGISVDDYKKAVAKLKFVDKAN
jgi:hypothetical protein